MSAIREMDSLLTSQYYNRVQIACCQEFNRLKDNCLQHKNVSVPRSIHFLPLFAWNLKVLHQSPPLI